MLSAPLRAPRAISGMEISRLRLDRGAGHGDRARIEVGAVRPHGSAVFDGPAGDPLAETWATPHDLFLVDLRARLQRHEHAPVLVRLVDVQRLVRHQVAEGDGDPLEQGVEALLGEHLVEHFGEAAVRLDECLRASVPVRVPVGRRDGIGGVRRRRRRLRHHAAFIGAGAGHLDSPGGGGSLDQAAGAGSVRPRVEAPSRAVRAGRRPGAAPRPASCRRCPSGGRSRGRTGSGTDVHLEPPVEAVAGVRVPGTLVVMDAEERVAEPGWDRRMPVPEHLRVAAASRRCLPQVERRRTSLPVGAREAARDIPGQIRNRSSTSRRV